MKMICTKSNKKLLEYGIEKGQVVELKPDLYNMIEFYDNVAKITRHIHLSRKLMRKFKEDE